MTTSNPRIHHLGQRKIPYVNCGRLTKFDIAEIERWLQDNSFKEKYL